jgi:hypothetical protein
MPATPRRACKRMQHCSGHENCRDHRCFERSQNYDLIQLHHGRVAPVGVKEVTWEADSTDTLKGGHRTRARISESASRASCPVPSHRVLRLAIPPPFASKAWCAGPPAELIHGHLLKHPAGPAGPRSRTPADPGTHPSAYCYPRLPGSGCRANSRSSSSARCFRAA